MTETHAKTPWHLWLAAIVAILFNAIGAFDFTMNMVQGPSYMAAAGMTPAQIEHYREFPSWMVAVWGVGVWAAILASILLLLRKRLAYPLFALSIAAFLVNCLYTYGLTNGGEVMGKEMAITSVIIAALLAFFIWYSRAMARRGVLR